MLALAQKWAWDLDSLLVVSKNTRATELTLAPAMILGVMQGDFQTQHSCLLLALWFDHSRPLLSL